MKKRILVICLVLAMMLDVTGVATTDLSSTQTTISLAKKKKKMVYITATGRCYHRTPCGSGTYYKVTLKRARELCLDPCKKCYG